MAHAVSLKIRGEGQPVVLLHSGGMSSRQWKKLSEILATSYKVITPDFLGSGENPPWPSEEPFDLSFDLEAINAIVDNEADPVHLVGHSYGGLIALLAAKRAPSRVRSLSLYDPVAFGVLTAPNESEALADLARVGDHPLSLDFEEGGNDAWLEIFIDYWNDKGSWRAMPEPARAAFLRVGRKVFYEVTSLMKEKSSAESYSQIQAPALFLIGERSPLAARRVGAILAASLPHGRAQVALGAGHMGPITHADFVNEAIVDFIRAAST